MKEPSLTGPSIEQPRFTLAPRNLQRLLIPALLSVWATCPIAKAAYQPSCDEQNYEIEARLDEKRHIVDGTEAIQWCNTSSFAVDRLYFHLYLNAFKGTNTVFIREGGARLRNQELRTPGGVEVRSIKTSGGLDLSPSASTGLLKNDSTQMVVVLPFKVAPGERIELRIEFQSHLPQIVARSGYWRQFHMVAQWFPKLARLEPDGHWASFPYHGMGEFYADFARYKLVVDVPHKYLLGASGKRVSSQLRGSRRVETYIADRVHDVAWCAYPYFKRYTFTDARPSVEILAPLGYDASVVRHIALVRAGISRFSRLFGAYPYSNLTIIIPPRGAQAASGMEYPTLFVSAGPWISWTFLPIPHPFIDEVAAHELAHQWFQGIIANNEVEAPVLDEGIAQWASSDLLQHLYRYRSSPLRFFGSTIDYFEFVRARYVWSEEPNISSALPAYSYTPNQLTRAVYLRPALLIETISRVWGRAKVEQVLGRYARDYRFGHPKLADLFSRFDGVFGAGFTKTVLKPVLVEQQRFDTSIAPLNIKTPPSNLVDPPAYNAGHAISQRISYRHFFPFLLFIVQAFLGVVGV